jgi:hypothetical protein
MSNQAHPQWCTQEHHPDEPFHLCTGPGRGFTTASGGSAWVRPVQVSYPGDDPIKPQSYISVYGRRSHAPPGQDPAFRMALSAADATPFASLLRVLSGAGREQFRELVTGISAAQAALTGTGPEAGT